MIKDSQKKEMMHFGFIFFILTVQYIFLYHIHCLFRCTVENTKITKINEKYNTLNFNQGWISNKKKITKNRKWTIVNIICDTDLLRLLRLTLYCPTFHIWHVYPKFLILEGIIKIISYEHRDYESVAKKILS